MRMNIYIAGSLRLEVMGMEVENAYMSDAVTHTGLQAGNCHQSQGR